MGLVPLSTRSATFPCSGHFSVKMWLKWPIVTLLHFHHLSLPNVCVCVCVCFSRSLVFHPSQTLPPPLSHHDRTTSLYCVISMSGNLSHQINLLRGNLVLLILFSIFLFPAGMMKKVCTTNGCKSFVTKYGLCKRHGGMDKCT